ncbi:MAG TPA: TIGR02391 family protein [Ktedonobacteraceae bacterium]|nr:TIGR02391 family protein [Ktedonobacteraceae bacterium]
MQFNTRDGRLRFSEIEAEQQGILSIYQGLIAFFRNSTGHRVVDTSTQHNAFCFMMWVDLLLRLVAAVVERGITTSGNAGQET